VVVGGGAFEGCLTRNADGLIDPIDGRCVVLLGEGDVAGEWLDVVGEGASDGDEEPALGCIGVVDECPDGASGSGCKLGGQSLKDEAFGVAGGAVDGEDCNLVPGREVGEWFNDGPGIVWGRWGSEVERGEDGVDDDESALG